MLTYEKAINRFNGARSNLLLVTCLSLVNILLLVFKIDISFLFSANFPLISVILGNEFAISENNDMYYAAGIFLAFLSIAAYFICYLLSKKRRGWIVAALVLFIIDTVLIIWLFLLGGDLNEIILDLLLNVAFHALVLFYLILGVKSWADLKTLPVPEPAAPAYVVPYPVAGSVPPVVPQPPVFPAETQQIPPAVPENGGNEG